MKKVFFSLLAALLLVSLVACTTKEKENDGWNKDYKVAMVTDYGDITDQSFNQATYEGAKAWCEENKVHFTYKKPVTNSDADRIAATEKAIDEATESKIIELKDNATSSLADYQEKYGSNIYGLVAYILNLVRIYSIPLCFLGIAIGAIHQYVIGIRKLDTLEKGMGLIVTFVTLLIICQILPLAFAMFVKFGRG